MPPDDRTIVEGSSPDGSPSGGTPGDSATIIEGASADSSTIIEGTQARAEAGFNLVPGGQFQGHTLLKPLQVTSGEADLWFIADTQGKEYVLKLYRYGIKPKEEITQKIRSLGYEHVVTIEESGEVSGRHFEILEKIEHGDLDDYAGDKPLEEEQLKVVVEELGSAVAHLHEAGIIHRDIKPANILVRTIEPLDLVMTDFGISSVSDVSLHMTSVNRTASYSAPEAFTGQVSKGSDWWSVGVIILELLKGKHPFAGMDERAVNFQLVAKGVKVPEEISEDWKLLLKGLLTRDPDNRWAWNEVEQWLGGKRDIATQYEGDQKEEKSYRYRPYKLRGREIYEPKELAIYLGENWEAGKKDFARGMIRTWVEAQLADQDLTRELYDIIEDEVLDGDEKLSAGLMVMATDLPMFWKGEVVSRDWLVGNPEATVKISHSRLLHYYDLHRSEDELKLGEIAARVKEVAEDEELQGEERDLVVTLAANPEHPLKLGEDVINPEWLAANPKKAVELCQSTLPGWHKRLCKEDWLEAIAVRVKGVAGDEELQGEERDLVVTLAVNPEQPMKLGEDVINLEWLAARPVRAIELCQGKLPEWHKRLCKEDWLEKKAKLIRAAGEDKGLEESTFDSVIDLILDEAAPLKWKGEEITPQWLAAHPDKAIELYGSRLPEWFKSLRKEDWLEAIAGLVRKVVEDKTLKGEIRDAVISLVVNPEHPLKWGKDLITQEWLAAHPKEAVELCRSRLPERFKSLRKEDWLEKKAKLVRSASEDKGLNTSNFDSVISLILDEAAPLKWKGEEVTPQWLAAHPKEAMEICQSRLPEWFKSLRKEDWLEAIAVRVKRVIEDRGLLWGPIRNLAVTLAVNPEHPLKLGEELIDSQEWMAAHPEEATKILKGSLPVWQERLTGKRSLIEARDRRNAWWEAIKALGVPVDENLVDELILQSEEDLAIRFKAFWQKFESGEYAGAKDKKLQALLDKGEVGPVDQLVLLCCDKGLFLTAQEKYQLDSMEYLKGFGVEMDWELAGKLIASNSWEEINPLWQEALDNPLPATSWPMRFKTVIHAQQAVYLDVVAVVSAWEIAQRQLRREAERREAERREAERRALTGKRLWEFETGWKVLSSPAIRTDGGGGVHITSRFKIPDF